MVNSKYYLSKNLNTSKQDHLIYLRNIIQNTKVKEIIVCFHREIDLSIIPAVQLSVNLSDRAKEEKVY